MFTKTIKQQTISFSASYLTRCTTVYSRCFDECSREENIIIRGYSNAPSSFLRAQDALLILRHSFSSPFIQHLLREIFCGDYDLLRDYDTAVRSSLAQILNIQLDDASWLQASLPISAGGLGIRSAVKSFHRLYFCH